MKRILTIATILAMTVLMTFIAPPSQAQAAQTGQPTQEQLTQDQPAPAQPADRTIMLYLCGTNLESGAGLATYNLKQVLRANFSSSERVKFIVMTGGAIRWHLKGDYLADPNDLGLEHTKKGKD